jgi:type II secretory pathway pseudopilin PulG
MLKQKGQSLVEVLVAIGVVGFALTALGVAMTSSVVIARVTKERSMARQLVEKRFEEVRNERDQDRETWFSLGSRTESYETETVPVYTIETDYLEVVVDEEYSVVVTAEWQDGSREYSYSSETRYSLWQ